jgi:hypothetical protein
MMSKVQPAIDAAGGQSTSTRTVGRAVPVGTPDTAALARCVPVARSAATSAPGAAVAPDPATVPADSVPEAIAGSAILAPGITRAPASTPMPGNAPSLSATATHSSTWQANLARLEGLAEVLSHHGLRARLMTPPGRVPSLHVVNPSAAALAEDVYAGRGQDGLWWFWWSWAERIAVGEDLEGAASLIKRVLAASS